MSKTMCESSEAEKREKRADARFICKRCGEAARKEKHLCKPKKMKDKDDE